MEQINIIVLAELLACQAEIEAMKIDNKIREMECCTTFNYGHQSFMDKAQEFHSIKNQLYR